MTSLIVSLPPSCPYSYSYSPHTQQKVRRALIRGDAMVVIVRAYSNEFRMRNHERERGREMKKIPTLGQMSGNWDVKKFLFYTLLFLLFSFFFLFLSPRFKSIFKYACYLSAKIEGMFERLNLSRMDRERERERERSMMPIITIITSQLSVSHRGRCQYEDYANN